MKLERLPLSLTILLITATATAQTPDTGKEADTKDKAPTEVVVPFYGNETCPISGRDIDQDRSVQVSNDKVYVCCKKCVAKVKANPESARAKAYPADATKDAENAKCPIKGKKPKESVFAVWQGHKVSFCCAGCKGKFLKAPERRMAMFENPGATELGNEHCLVMPEEEVDGESFFIYGDKLIDICCGGCADDFAESPEKYLKEYEKAQAATQQGDHDGDKKHEHGDSDKEEKGHDHGNGDHDHKQ